MTDAATDPVTLTALLSAAITIGLGHTLIGVDHYLPFIVIARAERWTYRRLLGITALCGVGHVLGSVLLGLGGVAIGAAVGTLEFIEAVRGGLAAWALIAFGLTYFVWATWRTLRGREHSHLHVHGTGAGVDTVHTHPHGHSGDHAHPHAAPSRKLITVWSLFIVFVLGPCEPLIPLLMVPAATLDWSSVVLVTGAFGATTIVTMLAAASVGYFGLSVPVFQGLERWANSLAGLAIASSGVAIQLLGL